MTIRDKQLDVAAASFEVVVDGMILVFANVVAYVKIFALRLRQGVDELASEHLIGATLAGHNLTGVVVAKADVIGDFDASLQSSDQSWVQLSGIEIRCLNEDGCFGVANAREPSFVLRDKHIAVVGFSVRKARNECNWERSRSGDGNIWCELVTIRYFWPRWPNGLGTCQVELSVRGLES